jgi:hypothetical protein
MFLHLLKSNNWKSNARLDYLSIERQITRKNADMRKAAERSRAVDPWLSEESRVFGELGHRLMRKLALMTMWAKYSRLVT